MENKVIKYKGWIVEQDEINTENESETIVTFYKTEEDYKNGDYDFNISLDNEDLEKSVKEYIDNELGENKGIITFNQALEIVRELAKGQGFYCRLLQNLENATEEQKRELEQDFEFCNVKDSLDLVFYFET